VKLGMTAGRLQSGVNTLQGFKEDKRNKVTPGKSSLLYKQNMLISLLGIQDLSEN
uniref:Uncharacterized protein n=1 Tax=Pavo cristatus TaxID=9049 RepID=A0A8C9F9B0_PAVCR